ncbi:hypothetical protein GCM10010252_38640 [Streptomyces aureoverticillatus]|nr:hypothetical protein GCM10010252_38640 [Streptomyces aureoverticillatus]
MPLSETRATPISPGSHTAFYRLFGSGAQPARGGPGPRSPLASGPPSTAGSEGVTVHDPRSPRVHRARPVSGQLHGAHLCEDSVDPLVRFRRPGAT